MITFVYHTQNLYHETCDLSPTHHHFSGRFKSCDNWGHMMGFGYGGGFMWIIVIVLVGVVIYFLLQASKSKGPDGSVMETPLDILKKRYAKGDKVDQDKRSLLF